MKFGNLRIKGVQPKFFAIIGSAIALTLALLIFWPSPPAPVNYLYEPAFPTNNLNSTTYQSSGWIEPYMSQYGLVKPQSSKVMIDEYAENVGLPFRFKTYIPDSQSTQQGRPDLVFTKYGLAFTPGAFLPPNQSVTSEDLQQSGSEVLSNQPIELAFPNASTPPGAQAYEITGLLYWRSDLANPPEQGTEGAERLPSPVMLVDNYAKLSPSELRAPTTQRVPLDLSYQEGNMRLAINNIEWSSGRELRVCVTLDNVGSTTLPVWDGVSSMVASAGDSGSITGAPDDNSALSQTTEIEPDQVLSGQIIFGQAVSDPNQPLSLVMPALTGIDEAFVDSGAEPDSALGATTTENKLLIDVPQDEIKKTADQQISPCGAPRISSKVKLPQHKATPTGPVGTTAPTGASGVVPETNGATTGTGAVITVPNKP